LIRLTFLRLHPPKSSPGGASRESWAKIEARREASAIIIAEQGRWNTAIIRPLLASPIIIYFWKVIVWNKVFGLGTTDPITGMIADWTRMIITAYVGGRSIEKVAVPGQRRAQRIMRRQLAAPADGGLNDLDWWSTARPPRSAHERRAQGCRKATFELSTTGSDAAGAMTSTTRA
jgi:hypothetical protein